ncbi:hypothetical protein JOD54_001954 [Actinokineospora baliensis]|uniref:hypothetical protein n=1 Tax=Actinokineospora baliensis TaxID=547056 RepID=UPI00195C3A61|nr:hypothetical protein [Actinokineospora baliensis]MBM7771750.1 hypothetical protein [Actinokineospora baliensis]
MTATTFGAGAAEPDVTAVARAVLALLELERGFGSIPEHATLRVAVMHQDPATGVVPTVVIGGLDDEWLLGPGTTPPQDLTVIPTAALTLRALALHHTVAHAVFSVAPQREPGRLWWPFATWLAHEAQWATCDRHWPLGVFTVADDGTVQ